jgi:serine/threonine-protein kinase
VAHALELDDRLPEAHAVNGLLRMVGNYDWAGAEAEFKLALELNPNSADTLDHYGWLCSAQCRFDEAIALVRRAQELDPLTHRADLANTYLRAGRLQEAKAEILRALEFEPRFPRSRAVYGWVRFQLGEVAGGIAELELAVQVAPDNMIFVGQLGEMYGLAGRTEDARAILARMESLRQERYVSPYYFAYVHTGLGEYDKAMDCLERAYLERAGSVFGIKGSFVFEPLQEMPRFRALLRRMNLD